MKSTNKLLGSGIFAAIAASLCCITPVLALIAGTSGIASTFSWIEPFRPFFIGLTGLILLFAWYKKLSPKQEIDCNCEVEEKPKFINTKAFLGIITVFAVFMLAFPYYSGIFYPKSEKQISSATVYSIQKVEFSLTGMTCSTCAAHVNHEVNKLPGILKSDASYEKGNAVIEFDSTKIDLAEIIKTINSTGYTILETGKN